jgi:hypothetical protein
MTIGKRLSPADQSALLAKLETLEMRPPDAPRTEL